MLTPLTKVSNEPRLRRYEPLATLATKANRSLCELLIAALPLLNSFATGHLKEPKS